MSDTTPASPPKKPSRMMALVDSAIHRATAAWNYVSTGVWADTRRNWRVSLVKTLNITVRSFLDVDLQSQACALTYRTVLALVPALALLFAICRGFGFQNLLQNQLYHLVPSQHKALEMAMQFVDSYLSQASEGLFVGVGILFLLWTLISLLGSVEDSFNRIWQVKEGRTIWRKVTDYLAIFLILPVLMICAGGITIVMSTALKKLVFFEFMGPVVNFLIDALGVVLTWLFFAGAYMLIPNAKVRFLNAFAAGAIVGTSFMVIQWLFVTGQMYVTKYNAIYGSFSFLPLLLIWLQLSWLVTLTGALVCYASQNIGQFTFYHNVERISASYGRRVSLAVLAIVVKRFAAGLRPVTVRELADDYGLPVNLMRRTVSRLHEMGLIAYEQTPDGAEPHPLLPAKDIALMTVGDTIRHLDSYGDSDFIPDFDTRYAAVDRIADDIDRALASEADSVPLASLDIDITSTTDINKDQNNPNNHIHHTL